MGRDGWRQGGMDDMERGSVEEFACEVVICRMSEGVSRWYDSVVAKYQIQGLVE